MFFVFLKYLFWPEMTFFFCQFWGFAPPILNTKNERLYDGSVIHNNGFHSLDIIYVFIYPPNNPHAKICPRGI